MDINLLANAPEYMDSECSFKYHNLLNVVVYRANLLFKNNEIDTPLSNHIMKMADLLITRGIDINHLFLCTYSHTNREDEDLLDDVVESKTSLHEALECKNILLAKYLLSKGADPCLPLTKTTTFPDGRQVIQEIAAMDLAPDYFKPILAKAQKEYQQKNPIPGP